ncbi:endogenous retrovirus group K member 5 Gag polyprotein-like [Dasypus novemcinctus]|uniref:endogenous retrovirus group K member 5 Gag polyprotein-like n=1 Tax=Dasypus novemcinctus TaxID=9361 RepID=UPI00265FC6D4|nr:endogenous retrovirus group K member 5 Gag polyprotein-like [Dasypus novemcinctus]
MGGHLSSRQALQVRALASLLDTNGIRVSLRQLQKYWDLLLPFNPWLATGHIWSPETYTRLIDRVTSSMENDGRSFPLGLLPTLVAIRACLLGAPAPKGAYYSDTRGDKRPLHCGSGEGESDPDDSDNESLSDQLNADLEQNPPKDCGHQDGKLPPSSPPKRGKSPPGRQDGKLPPSSPLERGKPLPEGQAGGNSSSLYPPLPVMAPSWSDPEGGPPPSYKPLEVPRPPFGGPPEGGTAPSWGQAEAARPSAPSWVDADTWTDSGGPPRHASGPPHSPTRTQCPHDWYPFTPDEIKNLRRAVKEDGLGSPYAQQLLEELGTQLVLPYDWVSLGHSILTPGQFIEWRAHFQAEAERRVAENARTGVQDPTDAYTGTGRYADPTRYQNALPGFWLRLREVALRAFRSAATSRPQKFTQLTQGKDEEFSTFVSRVTEACKRKVVGEQAQLALSRELILEGANEVCRQVILTMRDKGVHDWVLACRSLDPQATSLAKAIATALAISSDCFRCGETGHFARECPHARPTAPPHAIAVPAIPPLCRGRPTPCPRCGKGYHWARDCRSTNANQPPLNTSRGRPQPCTQEAKMPRLPQP